MPPVVLEFESRLPMVKDPATSSIFPCMVQFLHLMLKLAGLHETVSFFHWQSFCLRHIQLGTRDSELSKR